MAAISVVLAVKFWLPEGNVPLINANFRMASNKLLVVWSEIWT